MPIIWQLSIVNLDQTTQVSGVIMKNAVFNRLDTKVSSKVKNMIWSYLSKPCNYLDIAVLIGNSTYKTRTDRFGSFKIEVIQNPVDVKIVLSGSGKVIPLKVNYPTTFNYKEKELLVISDIDDTIMESHSTNWYKRIRTLAFKGPKKRVPISFTINLMQALESRNAGFFYLSKSESNLFGIISGFILQKGLPIGKIFLTKHLPFYLLLNPKKDQHHKVDNIRFLMRNSGNKLFILIGDDTQRDMEIYTTIVKEFRERIAKVYIRQVGPFKSYKKKARWTELVNTEVPALYFKDTDDIDEEIKSLKAQLIKL